MSSQFQHGSFQSFGGQGVNTTAVRDAYGNLIDSRTGRQIHKLY